MRIFAPLTEADLPVPAQLLDELVDSFDDATRWVIIGATARDFALLVGSVNLGDVRATRDVDLAVAVQDAAAYRASVARVGRPGSGWQRRTVLGQQVDIVPFGGIERAGEVVVGDNALTVLGCAEAATFADQLELPSGRLLPVAPLELIAVLKLIAFGERHPGQTKDRDDLDLVLRAASEGVYGEEVWQDDDALAAGSYLHDLAGAYRLGRRAMECFRPDRAELLRDAVAGIEDRLRHAWNFDRLELLEAWLAGLRAGAGP